MGRYVQHAAPSVEPVSLADAKQALRLTGADEDGYLTNRIVEARRLVERWLGRQLITATWKLYLDEFPDEVLLEKLPVATVTSITYVDLDGTTQTLASADYQTDITSQDTPARIMPAYGKSWPDTRADTYNAVCVTFTAGYGAAATSVPDTIKAAILLLVGHRYELREPLNIGNIVNEIPFSVQALLAIEDSGAYA